jgi:hypothetical protein
MAAAMAALEQTAAPVPIHKLPLQPIVPTAACSGDGEQEQLQAAAAGSVQFQTHKFYILPHLAKLAAAEAAAQAAADDAETAVAAASGSTVCSSSPLAAAAAAALSAPGDSDWQLSTGRPGAGAAAGDSGIAASSVAALAASAAEYMQQLKLNEVSYICWNNAAVVLPVAVVLEQILKQLNCGDMLKMCSRRLLRACCGNSFCVKLNDAAA